jgi:hypothetical protein
MNDSTTNTMRRELEEEAKTEFEELLDLDLTMDTLLIILYKGNTNTYVC